MIKNKRGTLVVVGLMIGLLLLVALVTMIEPIKDQVNTAKNSDNLDCSNTSISTEQEMACIQVGFTLPLWVGIGLGVALAAVGGSIYLKNRRDE